MNYLCVNNSGYEKSLTIGKAYLVQEDSMLINTDLVRLIDNTGVSYLYPQRLFSIIGNQCPVN